MFWCYTFFQPTIHRLDFRIFEQTKKREDQMEQITPVNTPNWWKIIAVIALVSGLGCAVIAVLSTSTLQNSQQKVTELTNEAMKNEHVITVMSIEQDRLIAIHQVLADPSTKLVHLFNSDEATKNTLRLFWSIDGKKAVMVADQLKPNSTNLQFQLWANSKGKFINLGVFDFDELDRMTEPFEVNAQQIDFFLLTHEQKGGNVTPTLEQLVAKGIIEN